MGATLNYEFKRKTNGYMHWLVEVVGNVHYSKINAIIDDEVFVQESATHKPIKANRKVRTKRKALFAGLE